jgi:hypothetical protein
MGLCSGYVTEVICNAAKTTQVGETCRWDTSVSPHACRAKRCTDAPTGTTTDSGCNDFLKNCKTNGVSCVESVTCPILITRAACLVDGNGKPCLYKNNGCHSYARCEDVLLKTHSEC